MCHGCVFEIYTIMADIDDGIHLVFGFKNMVETEGMLNTQTGEFSGQIHSHLYKTQLRCQARWQSLPESKNAIC